jgi:hypothetical protein
MKLILAGCLDSETRDRAKPDPNRRPGLHGAANRLRLPRDFLPAIPFGPLAAGLGQLPAQLGGKRQALERAAQSGKAAGGDVEGTLAGDLQQCREPNELAPGATDR